MNMTTRKLEMETIPGGAQLFIDTNMGRMNLRDFVNAKIKRTGLKPAQLEFNAGMEHATSWLWLSGKSESLRAGLAWLDALGYDLVAVKREDA